MLQCCTHAFGSKRCHLSACGKAWCSSICPHTPERFYPSWHVTTLNMVHDFVSRRSCMLALKFAKCMYLLHCTLVPSVATGEYSGHVADHTHSFAQCLLSIIHDLLTAARLHRYAGSHSDPYLHTGHDIMKISFIATIKLKWFCSVRLTGSGASLQEVTSPSTDCRQPGRHPVPAKTWKRAPRQLQAAAQICTSGQVCMCCSSSPCVLS